MRRIELYILYFTFCGFAVSPLSAQDYLDAFNEGQQLFEQEQYYEAYLRFNAAEVLSRNAGREQFAVSSREWLDKAAFGIQRQQVVTDSLLQATKKLTDAFYFWDGRLALAFDGYAYGYINKKGDVAIDYKYSSATNFEEATGYAKVVKEGQTYWLAPNGEEYPGDREVSKLPKVEREGEKSDGGEGGEEGKAQTLDTYPLNGTKNYHQVLNEGIRLFNDRKYYDAYLRFNAVTILAENAGDDGMAQKGRQLKDTAIYEIRNLFTRAKEALTTAETIRKAFYFYADHYALAFQHGAFYFIDTDGKDHKKLGRWEKAEPFGFRGMARVEKNEGQFLLDTFGHIYPVAYRIEDLKEDITALDLSATRLNDFPTKVLAHDQLQILILDGYFSLPNAIRTLPASIHKLRQLKMLSLGHCNLRSLPPEIGQLHKLQYLYLGDNQLSEVPQQISQLQQLSELDLDRNYLREVSPQITQLHNLTKLSLGRNQLTELPTQITQLQSLTSLDLVGNNLTRLPPQIIQLHNLSELNLGGNELTELPSPITQLQQLAKLDLANNQLTELPPQISQLQHLTELDLSSNELTKLPLQITQLKNLTKLDLSFNALIELPLQISQLQHLTKLDLSDNQLTELPPQISQLHHLTELNLGSNPLTELPLQITQLHHLTKLDLSDNQLTELPPQITQLHNLAELDLSFNELTELPLQITELHSLTELSLFSNQLTELPLQITQLQNLKSLSLGSNQLTDLPPQIAQLKNLNSLSLGNNLLTELPPQITQLQNLTYLSLSDSKLTDFPPQILELHNLTYLLLERNQLAELPPQISQLHNLTVLSLSFNQLTELPLQITQLQSLTELNLSHNQLTELPLQITQLQNLTKLHLRDNLLTELPPQITQLQHLTSLDLYENALAENHIEQLRATMEWCTIIYGSSPSAEKWFAAGKYQEAYDAQRKRMDYGTTYPHIWWYLSRYAVFAQKPQIAIEAALKNLELDSKAQSVEASLALGYLFSDQWEKAEKIYQKWKGKNFHNDNRLCDDVFLKDIQDLEAAGITHPDFEKVRQLFKK